MTTFRLNGILSNIVTKAADWNLAKILLKLVSILSAFKDQIRLQEISTLFMPKRKGTYMASHLSHACDSMVLSVRVYHGSRYALQTEDVRIVLKTVRIVHNKSDTTHYLKEFLDRHMCWIVSSIRWRETSKVLSLPRWSNRLAQWRFVEEVRDRLHVRADSTSKWEHSVSRSKRHTLVRRSIIRSNSTRNFLKAASPGPAKPCFWMGVRISLFQKQV